MFGAAACWGVRQAVYGSRPVFIHVRWAASASEPARRAGEQRYGLINPEYREGTTWSYTLTNVSRDNIRSLVSDPLVDDTHNIHRTAFRPWRTAPRLPYLTPSPRVPRLFDLAAAVLVMMGVGGVLIGLLEWQRPSIVRGPPALFRDFLLHPVATITRMVRDTRGFVIGSIPDVSAEAVAVFRVVWGAALLWIVLRQGMVEASWAISPTNAPSRLQAVLLQWVVVYPAIAEWLAPWTVLWALFFIAGAWARVSFAMLSLGAFAWAILITTQVTYHSVCALLTTLICLQWSRWSDAWSVDAWRRGPDAPRAHPRLYGYTTWIPGLVLGVTFAAAALAKLRESGIAWILNGTVKYHFLTDSRQAPVDWGLYIGPHHELAVALSLGAVVVEAAVILAVFSGVYRYRALAGIASVVLLCGFTFLQGIFWPGWWLLTLSFLPWHRIRVAESAGLPAPAARPVVAVTIAVIAAQLFVSAFRIEGSPLLSTYDMYATTYDSPESFRDKAGEGYFLVGLDEEGNTRECRLTRDEHRLLASPGADPGATQPIIARCFPPPTQLRTVTADTVRIRVDWTRWRLEEPDRVRVAVAVPPS